MINNIHKNIMGTISFSAKLGKMRKEQEFIIYPIKDPGAQSLHIQSDHRYGVIDLNGKGILSANKANYANSLTLMLDQAKGRAESFDIPMDEFTTLLAAIKGTADPEVGDSWVKCDNSGADKII